MPRDGCAPHEQSAPTGCSSSANGTCDRYWVSTPAVTTATARTSPASNDHPTMTAKRARRWTCRSSGGRNTRSDAIRLFLKRYRHRRAGRAGTGVGTGLSPRRGVPVRPLAGAWLVRKVQFATMNMLSYSGNRLLVFGCERSVSDTHRNSAAEGGQLPGLPEERMPAGLVVAHGRAHGARIAAQPAEAVGARCKPPGQIPGLAAANAAAVTR